MPWRIVLHESRPEHPRVGDMFPAPWLLRDEWLKNFAPRYLALAEPRRAPLVLRLPSGYDFCIDYRFWRNGGQPYGDGWGLGGEGANITLTPSVDLRGIYHGFIRNGVIGEDVEGRTFPDVPRTA